MIQNPSDVSGIRARRAYFDCRFGQLHVRTAFPGTGGFDEKPVVLCIHSTESTSRVFTLLMRELAGRRSMYAPDLPGYGESDASFEASAIRGAPSNLAVGPLNPELALQALQDFARELRLRSFDVVGLDLGAQIALSWFQVPNNPLRRLLVLSTSQEFRLPQLAIPAAVISTSRAALEDESRVAQLREPALRFLDH